MAGIEVATGELMTMKFAKAKNEESACNECGGGGLDMLNANGVMVVPKKIACVAVKTRTVRSVGGLATLTAAGAKGLDKLLAPLVKGMTLNKKEERYVHQSR